MGSGQIEAAWKEQTADAGAGWRPEWVPFLDDDRGNYAFLDTGQTPAPVREFWQRGPDRPTVAPSLAAWLEQFVTAVERGEYTQDPERGLFMRKREG
jgi:cell wall assembly regulator SMI1